MVCFDYIVNLMDVFADWEFEECYSFCIVDDSKCIPYLQAC